MSYEEENVKEAEGVTLKLAQDEDAQDPRTDRDNAGMMICWHRHYKLGDEHKFSDPEEFREWWKENGKGGVLLSLYLYDHSGITMSTAPFSCPWDSGQVGYIYVTRETILKEWGSGKRVSKKARQAAEKYLEGEVEEYDKFLTGDVWGYVIEDEDGEHLDSCWGYAKEEAESAFAHYVKKAKARRIAKENAEAAVSSANVESMDVTA